MAAKDYYALLGVGPAATDEEIRQAFLHQAEQYHPDGPGGGDQARMVEVCEAVDVLADRGKRALYDRYRNDPQNDATRREWESASADAGARALAFPARKSDLQSWLDGAAEVQKTRGGRILAGLAAGVVFGAVLAAAIGYFMHLDLGICAGVGAGVGACAGAFGAASNE